MRAKLVGILAVNLFVTVIVAVIAASATVTLAAPGPVHAEDSKPALKIAVLNLERVARATPRFAKLKSDWDTVQAEFKQWNEKTERDYATTVEVIRRMLAANPDADVLEERVAAQALEESLKAAREEQKDYLAALLALYQRQVLEDVCTNLRRYVRQQGYSLVLQDYDDAAPDADFFSDGAYAQSLMSKPVLDVLENDPNVIDITDVMIDFMRKGGVPEKKK